MLKGTKSGSILLFHNDLENTTEALPEILTKLRDEGYEFVTVSDLIFHENYTINADGRQIPDTKAGLDISAENVDEVMAHYSDKLTEMGFTQEQLTAAANAVKGGAEIPEQVLEVIARLDSTAANDTSSDNTPDDTESSTENNNDTSAPTEDIPDVEDSDVPDASDPNENGNAEIKPDKGQPMK